ncbi:unnamed protein product [Echinostoma caproni]|uniref:SAM domain-containing protein n=1 Tax=Echinostoma caproni TaxID=27848 RepID=A0A183A5U1_9TREM|nr:unnamed protein product [Echinostoma caproni]
MSEVEIKSGTTDHLQTRLIQLQKQVNAQAQRIAELEAKRKHPLNAVLGNVASLDKLDLLAEVSKQQFQIANLENANRELEMQVERLKASFLFVSVLILLFSSKALCQLGIPPTSSSRYNPLYNHKSLANSRSYMLSPTLNSTSPQPPAEHSCLDPIGRTLQNEDTQYFRPSLIGGGQFKSVSLNELRHHRVPQIEGTLLHRIPGPIDWTDSYRGYPPFSCESPYTSVYASPPLHSPQIPGLGPLDRLPPQYASNYHRQAYLTTRARSPPPTRTDDRAQETRDDSAGRHISDTTNATESHSKPSCDTKSLPIRRSTAPLPVPEDLNNFPTPPIGRRMLPASPHRISVSNSVPGRQTLPVDVNADQVQNKRDEREWHTAFHVPEPRGHSVVNGTVMTSISSDPELGQIHEKLFTLSASSPDSTEISVRMASEQTPKSECIDFIHWDKDMVSAWLYELGLGYSVPYTRRWLQHGSDLVHASRKEIEQVCNSSIPVTRLPTIVCIPVRLCMCFNLLVYISSAIPDRIVAKGDTS